MIVFGVLCSFSFLCSRVPIISTLYDKQMESEHNATQIQQYNVNKCFHNNSKQQSASEVFMKPFECCGEETITIHIASPTKQSTEAAHCASHFLVLHQLLAIHCMMNIMICTFTLLNTNILFAFCSATPYGAVNYSALYIKGNRSVPQNKRHKQSSTQLMECLLLVLLWYHSAFTTLLTTPQFNNVQWCSVCATLKPLIGFGTTCLICFSYFVVAFVQTHRNSLVFLLCSIIQHQFFNDLCDSCTDLLLPIVRSSDGIFLFFYSFHSFIQTISLSTIIQNSCTILYV